MHEKISIFRVDDQCEPTQYSAMANNKLEIEAEFSMKFSNRKR